MERRETARVSSTLSLRAPGLVPHREDTYDIPSRSERELHLLPVRRPALPDDRQVGDVAEGFWMIESAHRWSPAEQVEPPQYTVAADSMAAWEGEPSRALRQADRLPSPRYRAGIGTATLWPSTRADPCRRTPTAELEGRALVRLRLARRGGRGGRDGGDSLRATGRGLVDLYRADQRIEQASAHPVLELGLARQRPSGVEQLDCGSVLKGRRTQRNPGERRPGVQSRRQLSDQRLLARVGHRLAPVTIAQLRPGGSSLVGASHDCAPQRAETRRTGRSRRGLRPVPPRGGSPRDLWG